MKTIVNIRKIYIVGFFLTLFSLSGCDQYLDIVPDETPKIEDFFVNRTTAERFLVSLYSRVPFNVEDVPDQYSINPASDLIYCSYFEPDRPAGVIMGDRGSWTASNVVGDTWATNAANIRQCYIFLDNIDAVPGIETKDKEQWKAEAKFLIAYMHFQMLRQYGPIYLSDGIYSINKTIEELSDELYRHPYDECVEWIANLFTEAAEGLPATINDVQKSFYGKPTRVAALALIARLRLYAASPLFNGNSEFAGFIGKDGKQLISSNYDPAKWTTAAQAVREAIDEAEAGGHQLYNNYPNDGELNYKMAIVDSWNEELIWGASRPSSYGKSSSAYFVKTTMPVYVTANASQWGNNTFQEGYIEYTATLKAVELFYSDKGLPIEQDQAFDFARRYTLTTSSRAEMLGDIGKTLKLHENREPRFYASIGYDRGFFKSAGDTTLLKNRLTEPHGIIDQTAYSKKNVPSTGYYIHKFIHPNHSWVSTFGQEQKFAWPLVRLAELYLSYAEALNESGGDMAEIIRYLNKVRQRAGVASIEQAWNRISFSQSEMRNIIQQERSIELCFEGHRQWDMKRWKRLGEFYDSVKGLTITAKDEQVFNSVRTISERSYNRKYYLFPIYNGHLVRNRLLVQNPGW